MFRKGTVFGKLGWCVGRNPPKVALSPQFPLFSSFFEVMKPFLGAFVLVEIEDYSVIGELVHFSHSRKTGHNPKVLVLKNGKNKVLIRGSWTAIKLLEPKQ
jgi:hypothetical protein